MRSFTFKLFLLVNGLVALLTAGATLVLLLIAPLGLATVLTCTVLVGLFTLAGGLAGDLLIWRLVERRLPSADLDGGQSLGHPISGKESPLLGRGTGRSSKH